MKFMLYQSVAFMFKEFNHVPFIFQDTDDVAFKIISSVLPWIPSIEGNTHE